MNIYFNFNLLTLFLFNLSLLILIFVADYIIRKKFYFTTTYEELKNSYPLFLKYIDRYYITNFSYTIIASIIYIISTILIFLFIRYLFLGQANILLRTDISIVDINTFSIIKVIFQYLLFLLCIFLYRSLLKIIFYKEIIKLRIYIEQFYQYRRLYRLSHFSYGQYICKLIWILSYRIATQNFEDDLFEGDYDSWKHKALDYEEQDYSEIYNNIYVNKVIKYFMYISNKHKILALIFYCNSKIFKLFSRHINNGLFKFIPHMLIILCLLYELYNRELYYIYYATFCYFIYYNLLNFRKFEKNLNFINTGTLSEYFYENDFSYTVQRMYVLNSENYNINKKSLQNTRLSLHFNSDQQANHGIIYSVLNNMQEGVLPSSKEVKQYELRWSFTYLRITTLFTIIIINIFLYNTLNIEISIFNITVSNFIIFSFCLVMTILLPNIYYSIIANEFTRNEDFCELVYNRKYALLFWLLAFLQFYLYWLTLLKPELQFMISEILVDLPYNILKITKIYSQEEKIMYLFQYFEFYISLLHIEIIDKEYLRYIIRQIDYQKLITSDITLMDIQVYVKLLFDNHYALGLIYELVNLMMIDTIKVFTESHTFIEINPWYAFLRNTLMIAAITSTIISFKNTFLLYKILQDPKNVGLLVMTIYKKTPLAFIKSHSMTEIFRYIFEIIMKNKD